MLVNALAMAGAGEEARAAAEGLIEAAEVSRNPWALANALYTYGYAFGDSDPPAALQAMRRGLGIAANRLEIRCSQTNAFIPQIGAGAHPGGVVGRADGKDAAIGKGHRRSDFFRSGVHDERLGLRGDLDQSPPRSRLGLDADPAK